MVKYARIPKAEAQVLGEMSHQVIEKVPLNSSATVSYQYSTVKGPMTQHERDEPTNIATQPVAILQ